MILFCSVVLFYKMNTQGNTIASIYTMVFRVIYNYCQTQKYLTMCSTG